MTTQTMMLAYKPRIFLPFSPSGAESTTPVYLAIYDWLSLQHEYITISSISIVRRQKLKFYREHEIGENSLAGSKIHMVKNTLCSQCYLALQLTKSPFSSYFTSKIGMLLRVPLGDCFQLWAIFNCWYKFGQNAWEFHNFLYTFYSTLTTCCPFRINLYILSEVETTCGHRSNSVCFNTMTDHKCIILTRHYAPFGYKPY